MYTLCICVCVSAWEYACMCTLKHMCMCVSLGVGECIQKPVETRRGHSRASLKLRHMGLGADLGVGIQTPNLCRSSKLFFF